MGLICCKDRGSRLDIEDKGVHWQKDVLAAPESSDNKIASAVEPSTDPIIITDDKTLADGTDASEPSVKVIDDSMEAKDTFPSETPLPVNRTFTEPIKVPMINNLSNSTRSISISYSKSKYSHSNRDQVRINVDESIVRRLNTSRPRLHQNSMSVSKRLTLTRVSTSRKNRKKVRFNDKVIIHTIEYDDPKSKSECAKSETYVLIITLREIWSQLDLDKDGFLNMAELKNFCLEVWEEKDIDVPTVMGFYAKAAPDKGMKFHEWCSLVKDEDEPLDSFVDDLYYIFVEPSETEEID